MNRLLRNVARQIRYRPLPNVIGTTVNIESAASVPIIVGATLAGVSPLPLRFIGPEERVIVGCLAKYCHLDLTFAVDGVEWQPGDNLGTSILRECSFAGHLADRPVVQRQPETQDEDPTCMSLLADDIAKDQILLRLFLEERPRRDLSKYWAQTIEAGKGRLFEGGALEMETLLEGFFPHEMTVSHACLTNADSIWFHKHFYM